ncbi:MAG: helix-turn-helix domain-containing protein [Christensenellaceae bacterium]
MDRVALGIYLCALRRKRRWSRVALARRAGVSVALVTSLEEKTSDVRLDVLYYICAALDTSLYLVFRTVEALTEEELRTMAEEPDHYRKGNETERRYAWIYPFPQVNGRVVELRKAQGMSYRALARKAGISVPAMACIEEDKYLPRLGVLVKICDALAISLSEFFVNQRPIRRVVEFRRPTAFSSGESV